MFDLFSKENQKAKDMQDRVEKYKLELSYIVSLLDKQAKTIKAKDTNLDKSMSEIAYLYNLFDR